MFGYVNLECVLKDGAVEENCEHFPRKQYFLQLLVNA